MVTQLHSSQAAKVKLREIWHYAHNLNDLKQISSRMGVVKFYHGTPIHYAQIMVSSGPHAPYSVYAQARRVAAIYGLNWSQFQEWAYRKTEHVETISTAPAPVSARWAWSFPLGEILTDLNAHARMMVACNEYSRLHHVSVSIAYDDLSNEAIRLSRSGGVRYSTDSAPDILGLKDRLALPSREGAIVQVSFDASFIPDHVSQSAGYDIREAESGEPGSEGQILLWNESYFDAKIPQQAIKSIQIVVRGLYQWQQDAYQELIDSKQLTSGEMLSWIRK